MSLSDCSQTLEPALSTKPKGRVMSGRQIDDRLAPFIQSFQEGKPSETFSKLTFVVPNMNCAGCMRKIEQHFAGDKDLSNVRVNLSRKEVIFTWPQKRLLPPQFGQSLLDTLGALGFEARPLMDRAGFDQHDADLRQLVWCMAVAGFAAANVMLLSVSVWSGADGATRDLFHWLSALIALPAIVYAGRPFFRSALQALKVGQVNMDVPISLAVILAGGLSLFETINHGEHAFFDAAVSLLFFLLIGRTLDRMMRARAFHGIKQLIALKTEIAQVMETDGSLTSMAIADIQPGMKVFVCPGETIPIDGKVINGRSDVDWSLVTGESLPQTADRGDKLYSGLLNLSGPLTIETQAVAENTLLSEIVRLMEEAQSQAPRYRQLADRAASVYVPVVHLAAALTFIGWMLYGASWQDALYTAICVLIITCPCALGLAVPVVQVVANSIAHRRGVLMKDGAALEKLSEIDTVVFDKTGTLTLATPHLVKRAFDLEGSYLDGKPLQEGALLGAAATLARQSLHPLSQALSGAVETAQISSQSVHDVQEHPGLGLSGTWQEGDLRLGSAQWCGVEIEEIDKNEGFLSLFVSYKDKDGNLGYGRFYFEDQVRAGSQEVIAFFKQQGIDLHLFSGDREAAVARLANEVDISSYYADMKPDDKAKMIAKLNTRGHRVLMVGDGINDGPSLKAASVSLSPAKASEVAQVSSGFVLMQNSFQPLISLYKLAKASRRLIGQNFFLAFIYNAIAIPVAIMGGITPIIAALAMSGSSIVVMLNALRLNLMFPSKEEK